MTSPPYLDSNQSFWVSTTLSMQLKNCVFLSKKINNFQKSNPKLGQNRFLCKAWQTRIQILFLSRHWFISKQFNSKWRTCVLHRKQLIFLLSSDWLISIQNGGHAYCRGNRFFAAVLWLVDFDPKWRTCVLQGKLFFCCCHLIGWFRSKMAAAPSAETTLLKLK